jgi:8-hydroxy-5-deazaflavin:NADPH oxidoreductase
MKYVMNSIGVLGSGDVGRSLAKGFKETGHEVMIGTRDQRKPEFDRMRDLGISIGSFRDTAKASDTLVIATNWMGTRAMLSLAGEENFSGKLVIDVTNPLDFSQGGPPRPAVNFPDSAGKLIQSWIPDAKVIKAFNIISNSRMYKPQFVEGTPVMVISGDDKDAKAAVKELLNQFGWQDVADVGPIDNAYLQEGLAMLWIIYGFTTNRWTHGFALLKE